MPRARAIAPTRYTCTFRVRILGGFYAPPDARSVWRELELRADQTLEDLGEAIPPAFGFDDDHLWSFFLSGKPWDRKSEYARITSDDLLEGGHKRLASRLRVRDAPAGKEFLFLFDYGDEWHFGVKLARTGEIEPGGGYPRVVSSVGDAPPQYPDLEDDSDDDDEAYQQERERLLERYDAWAARQGISGDTSMMLAGLLDWKWEAEGRLTCWTADDLRELLLEWCPQALAIPDEELPRVVPGVRTLLRFLDETELLDPESDRLGALEATLDWAEPQFAEAMRDISRFSPAKAALSAMWAEGVDLDDSQAVDRFLSKFQLPAEIRLAGQGAVDTPRFPPVQTPPLDDLQTAAAAVPVVRQLCLLVEWVGEGRKLTAKGNLTVADGKDLAAHLGLADPAAIMAARVASSRDLAGLDLALAWAKELRLVRVHKGRLVRVKQQSRSRSGNPAHGRDTRDDPGHRRPGGPGPAHGGAWPTRRADRHAREPLARTEPPHRRRPGNDRQGPPYGQSRQGRTQGRLQAPLPPTTRPAVTKHHGVARLRPFRTSRRRTNRPPTPAHSRSHPAPTSNTSNVANSPC
jgi:hypothetical protein